MAANLVPSWTADSISESRMVEVFVVMMVSAGALSRFIEAHPTVQMLALSFLLLIGIALVADGIDVHIPKSSIYFAMGFSIFVEMLNIRIRKRATEPVHLRGRYVKADES